MRRADRSRPVKKKREAPRFELDRTWLLRGGLVLVGIAFILLLTKASMMLFGSGNQRIERYERAAEPTATQRGVERSKEPAAR